MEALLTNLYYCGQEMCVLRGSTSFMLQINIRENQRITQDWPIQRNWQHWAHKTKANKNTTRYVSDTTIRKQTQIT